MSILDKLVENRIVSFNLSKDKESIKLFEECDLCFDVDLSKEEFKQLIDELTELYNSMSSKND